MCAWEGMRGTGGGGGGLHLRILQIAAMWKRMVEVTAPASLPETHPTVPTEEKSVWAP